MFKVAVRMPTNKGYIRPNETVVFMITHVSDEVTTFVIDYRDGNTHLTTDSEFGHSWISTGTYQVNITAITRIFTETKFIQVNNL